MNNTMMQLLPLERRPNGSQLREQAVQFAHSILLQMAQRPECDRPACMMLIGRMPEVQAGQAAKILQPARAQDASAMAEIAPGQPVMAIFPVQMENAQQAQHFAHVLGPLMLVHFRADCCVFAVEVLARAHRLGEDGPQIIEGEPPREAIVAMLDFATDAQQVYSLVVTSRDESGKQLFAPEVQRGMFSEDDPADSVTGDFATMMTRAQEFAARLQSDVS